MPKAPAFVSPWARMQIPRRHKQYPNPYEAPPIDHVAHLKLKFIFQILGLPAEIILQIIDEVNDKPLPTTKRRSEIASPLLFMPAWEPYFPSVRNPKPESHKPPFFCFKGPITQFWNKYPDASGQKEFPIHVSHYMGFAFDNTSRNSDRIWAFVIAVEFKLDATVKDDEGNFECDFVYPYGRLHPGSQRIKTRGRGESDAAQRKESTRYARAVK